MLKKLSDTTALFPLGKPTGQRLLKLTSGPYAGRLVAIFLASPSELRLTFADSPYTSWSTPTIIASDCGDAPFDCYIAPDNTIFIAYRGADLSTLLTRTLLYGAGIWTPSSSVTAYNVEPTDNPSIVVDSSTILWLAFNRLVGGNWFTQLKSSADNGATWGTGPTDPGVTLSTGASFLAPKLLAAPETLHAFLAYGSNKLVIRSKPLPSGSWSDEYVIASGLTGFNDQYDAALDPDGRLAVVYNDSQFRVREFDGLAWSAAITLDTNLQDSPQVTYRDGFPTVLWLQSFSGSQKRLMFSSRQTGTYSAPAPLDLRADLFETVLLYSQAASTYSNVTIAASSSSTADIFHAASNCLVKQSGDALYVGMDDRFRYLHLTLSPVGVGGTVAYSYWNGSSWVGFTPASGLSHFDSPPSRLHLWTDYRAIPLDWQKKTVAGHHRFWVKCEVLSEFSIGPVGSQITAISELHTLIARR